MPPGEREAFFAAAGLPSAAAPPTEGSAEKVSPQDDPSHQQAKKKRLSFDLPADQADPSTPKHHLSLESRGNPDGQTPEKKQRKEGAEPIRTGVEAGQQVDGEQAGNLHPDRDEKKWCAHGIKEYITIMEPFLCGNVEEVGRIIGKVMVHDTQHVGHIQHNGPCIKWDFSQGDLIDWGGEGNVGPYEIMDRVKFYNKVARLSLEGEGAPSRGPSRGYSAVSLKALQVVFGKEKVLASTTFEKALKRHFPDWTDLEGPPPCPVAAHTTLTLDDLENPDYPVEQVGTPKGTAKVDDSGKTLGEYADGFSITTDTLKGIEERKESLDGFRRRVHDVALAKETPTLSSGGEEEEPELPPRSAGTGDPFGGGTIDVSSDSSDDDGSQVLCGWRKTPRPIDGSPPVQRSSSGLPAKVIVRAMGEGQDLGCWQRSSSGLPAEVIIRAASRVHRSYSNPGYSLYFEYKPYLDVEVVWEASSL
ncbi:hypothetical protein B0I35DRAFT_408672 [Stachybotrys elegans]|uniref:Uncharacterized protein n=1 Tax=Stachybotrys elegans TaxID=80388 RepID=A0A8K0SXU5_9HYPO|nr:hypothetical protein B0I35DRAFT_408672 [Stachybotrys elegans]